MPAGAISTLGKGKKSKQVFDDFTSFISGDGKDALKFEGDWVDTSIQEMQTAGPNLSPEEQDKKVDDSIAEAFEKLELADSVAEEAVLKADASVEKVTSTQISDETRKSIIQSAAIFAFTVGSVNDKHFWIRIGAKATKGSKNQFFSLPELNRDKRRSHLVHYFRHQISDLLKVGKENKLVLTLKRFGITPKNDVVHLLFTKGHLLKPEDRLAIVKDINVIFSAIKETDQDKRVALLKELKYFKA
jgi:hypothetical protein